MSDLKRRLEAALDDTMTALAEAGDADAVEAIRVRMLGRKGVVSDAMKALRDVPPADRPELGKAANTVKAQIDQAITARLEALAQGAGGGVQLDVTLPGRRRGIGRKHPIIRVMDDCVEIFRRMGYVVADGPDLEDEYHNFDALNTPADHPSRDVQDTFYLNDGRLLRTHTSPVQIRVMERQQPPVRIVAPGRCYRRDTPDATHTVNFTQIEGLCVDEGVSMADLKAALHAFAREAFGETAEIRVRPHFFPFTEPSVECDFTCVACQGDGCAICKQSGWLEIAGAGMVDPEVLQAVGYDSERYTGFAFGMGIERIAMLRYGISDIRLLYENDVRFLEQL
jgi:phenylalanyl-tRNA synthetase alpha chain